MYKALVIGAGSIGNHLTHACRTKGWSVDMYDIDSAALLRTRDEIYPARYGSWDNEIRLLSEENYAPQYDVAIIGTPPDSHLSVATDLLKRTNITCLLLEKPLCSPSLEGLSAFQRELEKAQCEAIVGYNHIFTANTLRAENVLRQHDFGMPLSMHVRWLEHWGGIFAAHPWLAGPADSYLGHWSKGGGACGEHSHAISLWQHFSNVVDMGRIDTVSCSMKMIEQSQVNYDQTAQLLVRSTKGLNGSIIQDVVTAPAEKMMRIQFEKGSLQWNANLDDSHDSIEYRVGALEPEVEYFEKTRPDDFVGQMSHIEAILEGAIDAKDSPNRLDEGISTMKVVSAAHSAHRHASVVKVSTI